MRIGLDEWDREFLAKYDKQRFIIVEVSAKNYVALATWSSPLESFTSFIISALNVPLQAAIQLEMNDLMNIISQSIAETIRGKSPEEIRQFFGLKKEFTPDEEAEIRRQNSELQVFEAILR